MSKYPLEHRILVALAEIRLNKKLGEDPNQCLDLLTDILTGKHDDVVDEVLHQRKRLKELKDIGQRA